MNSCPCCGKLRSRPPIERMMIIQQVLQAGGYPNATVLAEQLEVSTKSVHRDIEFLRDRLGLPIEYDPSRYGYRLTEPSPVKVLFNL